MWYCNGDVKMMRQLVIFLLAAVLGICVGEDTCSGQTGSKIKHCSRSKHPLYSVDSIIDCHPDPSPTEGTCKNRGCIWQGGASNLGPPNCMFPDGHGYRLFGEPTVTNSELEFTLQRISSPSLFGSDVETVKLRVEYQSDYRLRVQVLDPNSKRYEVPLPTHQPTEGPSDDSRLYDVTWENAPQFGVKVVRRKTGAIVFDTRLPGLVFADQFLQISTRLASDNVYGFGEHNHETLRHDMDWKRWVMFSKDISVQHNHNLYGVQPFYTNVEPDGSTNGVFFKNSNAMEVALQPDPHPAITFRTIGGILDFYIFLGPTPESVVKQFTEAVGRPVMPPYWALGFMLSRWGYNSSQVLHQVIQRNREAAIPLDVQFGDIDYMFEELDFTYDRKTFMGLPEAIEDLHDHGQKFIAIVDPAIGCDPAKLDRARENSPGYRVYEEGLESGVYIKQAGTDQPLVGKVWPGLTVFPDFTNEKTADWWRKWIQYFYYKENVKFDGLWIDMNEPASFIDGSKEGCDINKWNNPPFIPGLVDKDDQTRKSLFKTICMDSEQSWGRHYDVHSLYAHSEAIQTYNALRSLFPEKRPLVLTRSNYAGTSQYAIHWLGDNTASWEQLRESIIGILEYSIFGFSVTGPDICGFWEEASEELCMRWMELGAFYPFSRNHNCHLNKHKDPAAYGSKMISVSRNALYTRYKLLPYLYTLVHLASVRGSTVARPLFHEFPSDETTWSIDRQFLWGSSLMISPALEQDQRIVHAYFPEGVWYNYYTGEQTSDFAHHVKLNTPLEHINLHVRGGAIIPWQEPSVTASASRTNAFGLLVALDVKREAVGSLYWDDGESYGTYEDDAYLQLDFTVKAEALQIQVLHNNYREADNLFLETVDLYGLLLPPRKVLLNGREQHSSGVEYSACTKSARLTHLHLMLTESHTVEWLSF